MTQILKLEKLSTKDKLKIMEDIWVDLTKNSSEFNSPEWHRDVLEYREHKVKEGQTEFIDLEEAKKILKDRHS